MDLTQLNWYKSSYSGGSGGQCVEVARLDDGGMALRDTKDRSKAPHFYTREEWDAFLLGVKDGEFDL